MHQPSRLRSFGQILRKWHQPQSNSDSLAPIPGLSRGGVQPAQGSLLEYSLAGTRSTVLKVLWHLFSGESRQATSDTSHKEAFTVFVSWVPMPVITVAPALPSPLREWGGAFPRVLSTARYLPVLYIHTCGYPANRHSHQGIPFWHLTVLK